MLDISVLVTCYQKEKYLDECITSLVRQTQKPKEIIVVHDGCPEPMHHAQATSIMLKNNIGVARARHEAFRYSTGSLILFVDGDDVLSPDYLEKMTNVIASGSDIAYPDIYFYMPTGGSLSSIPEVDISLVHKVQKVPIPISSLMKREVYEKVGKFSDHPVLEDMDFWLRAMCKDYTFKRAETLLWYRQEGEKRNNVDELFRKQILKEILSQFEITQKTICQKHT